MNGKSGWYKIYLNETQRNMLKLNYRDKFVYIFVINSRLFISTNQIPIKHKHWRVRAEIAYSKWRIPIPAVLLPETNKYLARYSILPVTPDKRTCQIIPISPRVFIKEPTKYDSNIKRLSKTRRKEIERKQLQIRRHTEPTKDWKDPDIFDTLQ